MAAKPTKAKKEKNPNPNLALVIFLVFFILLTIGLGVWVYYDQETMTKANEAARNEKAGRDQEKIRRQLYSMFAQELSQALGKELNPDEMAELNADRDHFRKADFGKFASEKNKDEVKKLLDDLEKTLGVDAADTRNLKSVFKHQLDPAKKEVTRLEGALKNALAQNKRAEDVYKQMADTASDIQKTGEARIQTGNNAALTKAGKQSQSFLDAVENFRLAQVELKEKAVEKLTLEEEHEKKINLLKEEIAKLQKGLAQQDPAAPQAAAIQLRTEPYPLMLDISPGKPLWDNAIGKVMRVDTDLRQITINIGSTHGAKPELTFNIFGPGLNGRAEKQMKGSLEIIRVVDSNTSIARITSLYDADGREITLNDASRTRVLRESEAPIREGDLLFNMFWGTQIAIAGYVNITGEASDSPAEQIRQMEDFAHLCLRNGMQVDAYVDMRDGKIRGAITSKTRYLIRGDDLKVARQKKNKKDDEDDKGGKEEVPTDRNNLANLAKQTLYKDAVANGVLIISADNFATVIGYRKARSANNPESSVFRPALPYAGDPSRGGALDFLPKDAK